MQGEWRSAIMIMPMDEGTTVAGVKEWVEASMRGTLMENEGFNLLRARFQDADEPLGWQVRYKTEAHTVAAA